MIKLKKLYPLLFIVTTLAGCDLTKNTIKLTSDIIKDSKTGSMIMTSRSEKLKNLDFTCVKEQFPPLPQEVDQLYKYALYHDFKNRWLPKEGVLDRYLPYYRIAAANGHWQANLTLQEILLKSKDISISTSERRGEGIYWNEKLMKILPASAHYWWSRYIAVGYGPKHGSDDAMIYLRKAADLGNAKAQFAVRELIMKIKDKDSLQFRLQVRNKLQECAATQQFPDSSAAQMAAVTYDNRGDYQKAMFYSHQSTKAGNSSSALIISRAFYVENARNRHKEWGIPEDRERAKRYAIIRDFLVRHGHLKPELNVHDLDEIVPLPPAQLPKWDGKIAIQRFVEGPAPVKPSDELVRKLAQQAGLNPQTGLPK
ncbi:DUF6396 domain-containing protein [Neisseria sp. Dent CA1/247]|uniref:DUF6396 domain-containing protein n=1 Tax=Neisseria sp. Dent CA1/247 TaxID=2912675 RepID=UPI00351F5A43